MAKKHRLKKIEPLPHIEGDFDIVGCDLSLRCPGFALFHYTEKSRSITLLRKDILSNRSNKDSKKPHGMILGEIGAMFTDFLKGNKVKVVVRERALSRFHNEVQILNKVTGVTEMALWYCLASPFQEITPTQIKKYVAGSGRATKDDVAEAISNYCEHTRFLSDDESDACAVVIAWLVINGYLDAKPLKKYIIAQEGEPHDGEDN